MKPIEGLDYDLKMAFSNGRKMLEHTQKMTELYRACVENHLTIHGEWGPARHVLKAVNARSKKDFTVFWFSPEQFYVYFDSYGYSTFKKVDDVIKYVTPIVPVTIGNSRDAFFQEKLDRSHVISSKVNQQMHSRIKILEHFNSNISRMNQLGYRVLFDDPGNNIFNPVQGTRKVDGNTHFFFVFFDGSYKFFEFTSRNIMVKRFECLNVATLFQKITSSS